MNTCTHKADDCSYYNGTPSPEEADFDALLLQLGTGSLGWESSWSFHFQIPLQPPGRQDT